MGNTGSEITRHTVQENNCQKKRLSVYGQAWQAPAGRRQQRSQAWVSARHGMVRQAVVAIWREKKGSRPGWSGRPTVQSAMSVGPLQLLTISTPSRPAGVGGPANAQR